jgi:adenylosuccinate synthase
VIGKFININFYSIFRATLVSNIHREADKVAELRKGDNKIGTTL